MYHTVIAGFYGSKNNKFQKFSDSHYHVQNLLVLLSVSFSVLEPYSSIAYTGSEIRVRSSLCLISKLPMLGETRDVTTHSLTLPSGCNT